jgi:hypothetical protein
VPVLRQLGLVCGAWQMARAALVARRLGDDVYQRGIVDLAEFYCAHVLPQAAAWALAARDSAALCVDFDAEAL